VIDSSGMTRTPGFTLVELLVVLAIAGLLVALVPASISAAMPGARLRDTTNELTVALRDARNRAVSRGRIVGLRIVSGELEEESTGGQVVALPVELELRWRDAHAPGAVAVPLTDVRMLFYPDGSSSGGWLDVGPADKAYTIQIDWLTGRATVARGERDADRDR